MGEKYNYKNMLKILKKGKTGEEIKNQEITFYFSGNVIHPAKICGVYKITNLINDKIYIGSSIDVRKRWIGHVNSLLKNKHQNIYLQRSWDMYGPSNFKFELIDYLDNKNNMSKDLMKQKIRDLEQYYIDLFNSCNPDIGYNLSTKAESIVFDSSRYIKEGYSSVLTEEKFKRILNRLINTNDSLASIAKDENVKRSLIKDIYQKRAYRNATENLIFQDRSVNWARYMNVRHKYLETILEMRDNGKTSKEIAEKINEKEEDVIFLLSLVKNYPIIYQYGKDGKLIKKFYTYSQCEKELGIKKDTIKALITKKDIYNPKNTDIYLSLNKNINLTSLEEYFGHFITWNYRPIIERDINGNIINIYENKNSVPGYKGETISQKIHNPKKSDTRFFSFLIKEDSDSEEILKFLKEIRGI